MTREMLTKVNTRSIISFRGSTRGAMYLILKENVWQEKSTPIKTLRRRYTMLKQQVGGIKRQGIRLMHGEGYYVHSNLERDVHYRCGPHPTIPGHMLSKSKGE